MVGEASRAIENISASLEFKMHALKKYMLKMHFFSAHFFYGWQFDSRDTDHIINFPLSV